MPKKHLIPAAISILVISFLTIQFSQTKKNQKTGSSGSSTENTPTKSSADSRSPEETDTKTKREREREDPDAALARRAVEKEFDELLPAQFPKQDHTTR